MMRYAEVHAQDVRPNDVLYGHSHVTSVYQMIEGRSLWATYVMYPGGKEFKRFLGNYPHNHVLIQLPD